MHEDRRNDLADALRDEKELQRCERHYSTVFFDAPECPACVLLREYHAPLKRDPNAYPLVRQKPVDTPF